MDKLDKLIKESIDLVSLKADINGRIKAYEPLLVEWEAELVKLVKKGSNLAEVQKKHIFQVEGKLEVLRDLQKQHSLCGN